MPGEENLATVTPHQTKMAPSRGLIRSNASRPYLKEYPSWGFVTQNRCLLGRPRISPLLSDFYKSKASANTQNEARRSHNDGLSPAGTISRPAPTGRRLQKTPPPPTKRRFITREKPRRRKMAAYRLQMPTKTTSSSQATTKTPALTARARLRPQRRRKPMFANNHRLSRRTQPHTSTMQGKNSANP